MKSLVNSTGFPLTPTSSDKGLGRMLALVRYHDPTSAQRELARRHGRHGTNTDATAATKARDADVQHPVTGDRIDRRRNLFERHVSPWQPDHSMGPGQQ